MKLRLITVFVLVFIILLCTACVGKEEQAEKTQIKSTVVSWSDNSITVKSDDGTNYTFNVDKEQLDQYKNKLSPGNTADIEFYGRLDDFVDVQNVKVEKIVISQSELNIRLEKIFSSMTLEQKVGQMFIARCPDEDAAELADEYNLGGYVLFSRDFKDKTKEQVIDNINSYQNSSDIKMFIGVDEEGGDVVRVSRYPAFREEKFLSPRELYKQGGMELIEKDTAEKSRLLKSLGINLNLAPVCDVPDFITDYIYNRSFSANPNQTSKYVKNVVRTMNVQKIGCSLKHFPGYGNNSDTHKEIAYDKRSYVSFENSDFKPFKAGIKAGAGIVMVSHNIVYCMDESNPASLSKNVHDILRSQLNFSGVIMTDDISMEGITDFTDNEDAAVKAVLAGNDMLCCTDFEEQIPAVLNAVKSGEISLEQIDESVRRILILKLELGIIE